MHIVLKPIQIAISKPAQRSYLNTLLFCITSATLFGLATVAYILFYLNFIPNIGIERVVHLQYGIGTNPYGFVSLATDVIAQQAYDIVLELDVPRSPPNLNAGNFMLTMAMVSPSYKLDSQTTDRSSIPTEAVIYTSRRPAILTYHSNVVNVGKQIAGLPWYLLGWRRDAEKLEIKMAEGVSFSKGWRNVPGSVFLQLEGRGQDIQVYGMNLKLRARFSGLRWIMYNHRVFSFFIFTTSFWMAEMFFAILTWVLWSTTSTSPIGKSEDGVKDEGEELDTSSAIKEEDRGVETDDLDLSDTPRSFPTYGRQAPLKYIPRVKQEDDNGEVMVDRIALQSLAAEADDESEEPVDLGSHRDSGIGTSFSEGGGRGSAHRRRSKGSKPG